MPEWWNYMSKRRPIWVNSIEHGLAMLILVLAVGIVPTLMLDYAISDSHPNAARWADFGFLGLAWFMFGYLDSGLERKLSDRAEPLVPRSFSSRVFMIGILVLLADHIALAVVVPEYEAALSQTAELSIPVVIVMMVAASAVDFGIWVAAAWIGRLIHRKARIVGK